MKRIHSIPITVLLLILVSCKGSDKKTNQVTTTDTVTPVDTAHASEQTKPDEKAADNSTTESARPSAIVPNPKKSNDILANIDQYLVSTPEYTSPSTVDRGIVNGKVAVKNTLPDISFQKVIVEVSILLSDGKEYRTDYYILQNLEPGDTKSVPIPKTSRGNTVTSHIVKLKSDELTKGEMVVVGTKLVPH